MQITKELPNKEIERLDKKITVEMEQMKHDAEWILDRIGDPEAAVNYGASPPSKPRSRNTSPGAKPSAKF